MCTKTIQRKSYTLLTLVEEEKEKLAANLQQRIRTLSHYLSDVS